MSNKDSKKNFISRCHSTDYRISLRRILKTIWQSYEQGIVHTSYWEGGCYYTDPSQRHHMTPQLLHVFHTHTVLSHLHSNPIACIAAQWHSTQSPETSQGLWGQKPYISLGCPRVPSPDFTPPGSDFLLPRSVRVYSRRHLLLCKDKFSLPQSNRGYGYRHLSVPGIPSYFSSSLNVQPFFRKE